MLLLISPAKRLNWPQKITPPSSPAPPPPFPQLSQNLKTALQNLSPSALGQVLKIKGPTLTTTQNYYQQAQNYAPQAALWAYQGEVFQKLQVQTLDETAQHYLLKHLRILSALYGCLQTHTPIQPYRLEMASPFKTKQGQTLYDFWRPILTPYLIQQAQNLGFKHILNLASQEYAKVLDLEQIQNAGLSWQNIEFRQSDGLSPVPSVHAKQARGLVLRYLAQNQIAQDPQALADFKAQNYTFVQGNLNTGQWVFKQTLDPK